MGKLENFPCRNEGCDQSFDDYGVRTLHELLSCGYGYRMSRRTFLLITLIVGGSLSLAFLALTIL